MSDKAARELGDQAELADLRWHWDSAYEIDCADGAWTARPTEGTGTLSAGTAAELRDLIRADYLKRKDGSSGQDHNAARTATMGSGERALRQLRDDGVI